MIRPPALHGLFAAGSGDPDTRYITLLVLGLTVAVIVCSMPAGAAPAPSLGQGNQTQILYGVHPNAKTNETITAFIAEHGEIWWHEGAYNHTHKYVYIVPASACDEQLVYLNKIGADEHGGEPSIEHIWFIGCDEGLPRAAELTFPEIYEKYPALSDDGGLRSYVENQSPNRYEEVTARLSRAQVYFINDTDDPVAAVDFQSGVPDAGARGLSREGLRLRFGSPDREVLFRDVGGGDDLSREVDDVLREHAWEITVRAGQKTDVVQVPSDLAPGQSLRTTTPGFGAALAVLGAGMSFVLCRKRR